MIAGLELFSDFFKGYDKHYVLIGGVATMRWLEEAGMQPRATKDFDIVLIVESLNDRFLNRFWDFLKQGGYSNLQKSTGQRIYYRFSNPKDKNWPFMFEIFARTPDGMTIWGDPSVVPIPADEDASSLSAILMDDGYYSIVRDHREMRNGVPLLSHEGLILLKAKAWLDLTARKRQGHAVDERDINKHRNDVFKLTLLLTADKTVRIPPNIRHDLLEFLGHFPAESPHWQSIRQASGMSRLMPSPSLMLDTIRNHYVSSGSA
jgi:hypothetical protein